MRRFIRAVCAVFLLLVVSCGAATPAAPPTSSAASGFPAASGSLAASAFPRTLTDFPGGQLALADEPRLVIIVKLSDGTIERRADTGIAVLVVDPQGIADVARTATLPGAATGTGGAAGADRIASRLFDVRQWLAGVTARPWVYHVNRPGLRVGDAAEAQPRLVHPEMFR